MSFRSSQSVTNVLIVVAGIAAACSLQVPDEKNAFSGSVANGGNKSGGAAGKAGGSTADVGGSESGGMAPTTQGGAGGVTPTSGGAAGTANGGVAPTNGGAANGGAAGAATNGGTSGAANGGAAGTIGAEGGKASDGAGGATSMGGSANGGIPPISGGAGTGGLGGSTVAGAGGTGAIAGGGNAGLGGVTAQGGAPGQGGNPLTIGLVHWFKFDDPVATVPTILNSVSTSKNGTCTGCTVQGGRVGTGVETRNQYSEQPNWVELPKGLFQGLSATTVSFWFYSRTQSRKLAVAVDFSAGHPTHLYLVPDKFQPTTGLPGAQLGGQINGTTFVNLWYIPPTAGQLMNSVWHHVAFTWDASAIKFYIDGVLAGTQDTPGALPSDLNPNAPNIMSRSLALFADPDNPVYVDAESVPRAWLYYDEMKIYNRVLSDAEVASLYSIL